MFNKDYLKEQYKNMTDQQIKDTIRFYSNDWCIRYMYTMIVEMENELKLREAARKAV